MAAAGEPDRKRAKKATSRLAAAGAEATSDASASKLATATATVSEELPVCKHRSDIVEAVRNHRVVVLVGETGSGKTTQVPKFLHEAGLAQSGAVACTQPRRIAAISIANRVASEMGCDVGTLVGYHVRFANRTSRETRIKYMTDGMLVRECAGSHGLASCGVVVLDEAHERSINTDVLLGLVRRALDAGTQPELRVVVMSATLNAMPFVEFFGGKEKVKLLNVPGRQFPVQVHYTPAPEPDFLEAALIAVLQIHIWRPPGDVLVFLPGQGDIDGLQQLLEDRRSLLSSLRRDSPTEPVFKPAAGSAPVKQVIPAAADVDDFVVRPIYASLPFDEQELVFQPAPPRCRKIVLATNIAETSITIPMIRYVVDAGLMKLKVCHPQTGVEALELVETSQASAGQRAGRAGREAPGEVYRLYVESELERMPFQTPAEIMRCEMATVYLQLKALGIERVGDLPLVDKPPPEALLKAAHFLCRIGALDKANQLTDVGWRLSAMPIHPLYAYCLLVAVEFECMAEMLSIVAMLSTEMPFFVQKKQNEVAKESKPLLHEDGDHLSLLSIFSKWNKSSHRQSFARQHCLNHAALERALTIRKQLKDLVTGSWKVAQITSCGGPANWSVVQRCLLKACFTQTARLDEVNQSNYETLLGRQTARLHPSSVLFRRRPPPPCVVYAELVTTTRNYLRTATAVDPAWLAELCPQHFAANRG
eukprot:TRINITY_DN1372_c0_g1_i1.p1 TRINITY_DN1372_c0_g1~~TRINITY_DN1372_c0_g1_i1.p1  ORF type:complete len:707 (-),score=178.99 TRINITY_DN1372_c0_g1_i1:153-2273(-)